MPNCQRPHIRGECDKNCYYNTRLVVTNFDHIRTMSVEELSEWRANGQCPPNNFHRDYDCVSKSCEDCWRDWLKQEVNKDSNE